MTWPKYVTDFGPKDTFDNFRVKPAACNAAKRASNEFTWFSQVADKNTDHPCKLIPLGCGLMFSEPSP